MAIIDHIKKQIGQFVKSSSDQPSPLFFSSVSPSKEMPTASGHSFEQTYQIAYSHGLENIYALENVDPKKIRRIQESAISCDVPSVKTENDFIVEDQLELDLGDAFREWIEPFILDEPIHVLGLSRHAEKCLTDHGKNVLRDLASSNLQEFVFFKGMGQGHIDEIRQKLKEYLENYPINHCRVIDFASWIRTLVASLERKKTRVSLDFYGLADLISLSPAESVEVRRLTLDKKQEWLQEMREYFMQSKKGDSVKINMQKIVDVFVKPWLRMRQGFATKEELTERFLRISYNPALTEQALHFLSVFYFDEGYPLKGYLLQTDQDLFFADQHHVESFHAVISKACSYFYKPKIFYPFAELIRLLQREFACAWIDLDQNFIEKTLKLSSLFQVYKGKQGSLIISLA